MFLLMLPVLSGCLDSEINALIGAELRPAGLFLCFATKPHHSWLVLEKKPPTSRLWGCVFIPTDEFVVMVSSSEPDSCELWLGGAGGMVGQAGAMWCGKPLLGPPHCCCRAGMLSSPWLVLEMCC